MALIEKDLQVSLFPEFEELIQAPNPKRIDILSLSDYDKIIVCVSGGKDSLVTILLLLDMGVPKEKILLVHHRIDGAGLDFEDWPCTESYVSTMAAELGIGLEWSWREGGFYGELTRQNARTGGVNYTMNGELVYLPTTDRAKVGTRMRWPGMQMGISRWCTQALKVDIFRRQLNNDPRFSDGKFLVITGERREESTARSRYLESELHPCNTQRRTVHWWRNVIDWDERKVWDMIEKYRIQPHPAYMIGWSRTSCLGCIYSNSDIWHTLRDIMPERFSQWVSLEKEMGHTLVKGKSLTEMANAGTSRIPPGTEKWLELALSKEFPKEEFWASHWQLPGGAFKGTAGGPA